MLDIRTSVGRPVACLPLASSPRYLQVHTRSGRHAEISPINRPVIFGALETTATLLRGRESASPLLGPETPPGTKMRRGAVRSGHRVGHT